MPEDLTRRKRRARAFVLIVGGTLGVIGFFREALRRDGLAREDIIVAAIAAFLLAAGIVTFVRTTAD